MTNRDHHYLLPDDREAAEIAREYSAPQYAGHPLAQLYAMQHAVERHCPGESRQLIWASPIRMDYDARTFLWLPAFEFHRPLISAYH
ncbi:MAG: hypothetical protein JO019_02340 [Candidatus Kaiserbacteria bacterium]|nr:hypothetical protein [Candidatus Kaiserbacteria bacterium]